MPRAERTKPPYAQIQDHYRTHILDGTLTEGARLPSIAEIAREWEVAPATAAKAIAGLQVEGYVYSTNQGSYATLGKGAPSAHDRIDAQRRGAGLPTGQRIRITETGITDAPVYVAELLGVDPGLPVARRQWETYDAAGTSRLTVSWYPPSITEAVPALGEDGDGDALGWIEQATGRTPTDGRDWFTARKADMREARALGVHPGDEILASTYLWRDAEGVIEYGEWVTQGGRVVSFPYTIG